MSFSQLPDELVLWILSDGVAAWVDDESARWGELANMMLVCSEYTHNKQPSTLILRIGKWNLELQKEIKRGIPILPLMRRCECRTILQQSFRLHLQHLSQLSPPGGTEMTEQLIVLSGIVCSRGLPSLLEQLLGKGVAATARTPGRSHRCQDRYAAEHLIQSITAGNADDASLIHFAVVGGSVECVELLIARGANIEARCRALDETPLGLAVLTNQYTMAGVLMNYRARTHRESSIYVGDTIEKWDLVNCAAAQGNAPLVRLMVDLEVHRCAVNPDRARRKLTESVISRNDAALFQFLDHRGLVDKDSASLAWGVACGAAAIVRRILEAGVDPNQAWEATGEFPLTLALNDDRIDLVDMLIAHGAAVG